LICYQYAINAKLAYSKANYSRENIVKMI